MRIIPIGLMASLILTLSACLSAVATHVELDDAVQGQELAQAQNTSESPQNGQVQVAYDEAILPIQNASSSIIQKRSKPKGPDLELELARLSSRVSELEGQLRQQKEHAAMLERGMTLGLVPSGLKQDTRVSEEAGLRSLKAREESRQAELAPPPRAQGEAYAAQSGVSAESPIALSAKKPPAAGQDDYRQLLQKAQNAFDNANYGQAIALFNELGSRFDEGETGGNHHYWIGLSWFYLKEYKLAEESLKRFKSSYPSSPWASHAGFYLAKVDQARGLFRKSIDQFEKILEDYPDQDLSEMARAEIAQMREKL